MLKYTKKKILSLLLISSITSCGPSDVIVNIYGVSEYNCSTNEYRILKPMPMFSFLKTKKWYSKEEFHEANYKEARKPYKGLAMSEETLSEILPTIELSNSIFNEFIAPVDCENPKDIKF
tara:strand:+ start:101 stop:460 length:360 start_codon:yes stop_codon:yes gene_type:complete